MNGKSLFANTLINELGGWPLIGQAYNSSRDHLEQMLAFHKIGVRTFFYVGVDVNPKTPDYLTLEVIFYYEHFLGIFELIFLN